LDKTIYLGSPVGQLSVCILYVLYSILNALLAVRLLNHKSALGLDGCSYEQLS
jgi:hypothetical protein